MSSAVTAAAAVVQQRLTVNRKWNTLKRTDWTNELTMRFVQDAQQYSERPRPAPHIYGSPIVLRLTFGHYRWCLLSSCYFLHLACNHIH